MNSTNPYRSPNLDSDDTASPPSRTSLIWTGLFGGVLIGATYGAAGGGLYGLIVGLILINGFSEFTVGFVILLTISGAIIGTIWAAILGALFGMPIGWLAHRLAADRMQHFPIISALLSAVSGLALTALVIETFKWTSGSGEFNLYQALALALTTVAGGWSGLVLGRSLKNIRQESSESPP